MRRMREDLTAQLGSDVTPAQAVLIDEIAKKALIVRAVGDYILRQETLVMDGALLPVVMQHDRLVATLAGLLTTLGLGRRTAEVPDLHSYLKERVRWHPSETG